MADRRLGAELYAWAQDTTSLHTYGAFVVRTSAPGAAEAIQHELSQPGIVSMVEASAAPPARHAREQSGAGYIPLHALADVIDIERARRILRPGSAGFDWFDS